MKTKAGIRVERDSIKRMEKVDERRAENELWEGEKEGEMNGE